MCAWTFWPSNKPPSSLFATTRSFFSPLSYVSFFHCLIVSPVFLVPAVSLYALEPLQIISQSRPHLRLTQSSGSPMYLPPEIQLLIGHYLVGPDLKACAHVSKDWNAIFSPFFYASLNFNAFRRGFRWHLFDPLGRLLWASLATRDTQYFYGKLSSENFVRYGSCVKYLALQQNTDFREDIFSAIKSLKNLCIVARDWEELSGSRWDVLLESSTVLLTVNRGIQTLDLQFLDLTGTLSWMTQECPTLERLRLVSSRCILSDMAQILSSCSHLCHLSLQSISISRSKQETKFFQDELPVWELRELELRDCSVGDMLPLSDLVPCFPRLKSILVDNMPYELNHELQLACCPELTKVTISRFSDMLLDISDLLDRCPPTVTEISFMYCSISDTIMDSLRPRFKHLTSINLNESGCRGIYQDAMTSETASEIIRSCPNLVHLEYPQLHGSLISPSELNEESVVNQRINAPVGGFPQTQDSQGHNFGIVL